MGREKYDECFHWICLSADVCLSVYAQWRLNANSSKTVKAAYFKVDVYVPRNNPDMTPLFLAEKEAQISGRNISGCESLL